MCLPYFRAQQQGTLLPEHHTDTKQPDWVVPTDCNYCMVGWRTAGEYVEPAPGLPDWVEGQDVINWKAAMARKEQAARLKDEQARQAQQQSLQIQRQGPVIAKFRRTQENKEAPVAKHPDPRSLAPALPVNTSSDSNRPGMQIYRLPEPANPGGRADQTSPTRPNRSGRHYINWTPEKNAFLANEVRRYGEARNQPIPWQTLSAAYNTHYQEEVSYKALRTHVCRKLERVMQERLSYG